tara:strand:+ start:1238 stop:2026 length:789 start_codon:yes stop_codon:yes gene_type:complete
VKTWIKALIFCVALHSLQALSAEPSQDLFYAGAQAYSQGQLDEAKESFLKYLAQNPNDAKAHYNLSILMARQKNWPESWAHFYKARGLNPQLEGLSVLEGKLRTSYTPSGGVSGAYHRWIRPFIAGLSTTILLALLLLSLTSFFHFWIRFLVKRKWAREAMEAPPKLTWPTLTFLAVAIFSAGLWSWRLFLETEKFASVAVMDTPLMSTPSEDGFEIGKLNQGSEYQVLRTQENWVQVTNHSGQSGWVKSHQILTYPGAPNE